MTLQTVASNGERCCLAIDGEVVFSPDLAALLDCKDHIAALIATTQGSAVEGTENGEALQHRLQAYLAPLSPPVAVAEIVQEKAEPVLRVSSPALIGSAGSSFGPAYWHISMRFSPDLLKHGMDPLSFVRYLANYGEIVHLATLPGALPGWADYDAEACYLGFEVDLKSGASKEEIKRIFDFEPYKFMPVIMLTSAAQAGKKQEGQVAGAKAWVVKPFQPQQMLSAVAKLIM